MSTFWISTGFYLKTINLINFWVQFRIFNIYHNSWLAILVWLLVICWLIHKFILDFYNVYIKAGNKLWIHAFWNTFEHLHHMDADRCTCRFNRNVSSWGFSDDPGALVGNSSCAFDASMSQIESWGSDIMRMNCGVCTNGGELAVVALWWHRFIYT